MVEFEPTIDVKPGSYPSSINPKNKDAIPAAILTTTTFDASTVDPLSGAGQRDQRAYTIGIDPGWDQMHSNPGFRALLKQIGLDI